MFVKFRTVATALTVSLAILSVTAARADAIQGLFNTGVDSSGNALAENQIDPHWEIVASPAFIGTGTTPNYNGGTRADWVSVWTGTSGTPNTAAATWIVPDLATLLPGQFEDQDVNGNLGLYTFRTTFTIPEPFASAQITGLWAADNFGGVVPDFNDNTPDVSQITNYIRLNGNEINPGLLQYDFTAQAFTISSGFIQGENILEFNVSNTIGTSVPNPVGTQIVFTSATYAVPEPPVSILAASGIGIAGFRCFRRRRKA
jgi:hypothetical protein